MFVVTINIKSVYNKKKHIARGESTITKRAPKKVSQEKNVNT